MIEDKKFTLLKRKFKQLSLKDIEKLEPGQKVALSVYLFDTGRVKKFSFIFSGLELAKGSLKKHVSHFIHGKSKYLEDLPMSIMNNPKGEVRITISSDISQIFIEKIYPRAVKAKRPSPSESATRFRPGVKLTGGDGRVWKVVVTKAGVKRWSAT